MTAVTWWSGNHWALLTSYFRYQCMYLYIIIVYVVCLVFIKLSSLTNTSDRSKQNRSDTGRSEETDNTCIPDFISLSGIRTSCKLSQLSPPISAPRAVWFYPSKPVVENGKSLRDTYLACSQESYILGHMGGRAPKKKCLLGRSSLLIPCDTWFHVTRLRLGNRERKRTRGVERKRSPVTFSILPKFPSFGRCFLHIMTVTSD